MKKQSKRLISLVLMFVLVVTTCLTGLPIDVSAATRIVTTNTIDDFEGYSTQKVSNVWKQDTYGDAVTVSTANGQTDSTALSYEYTIGDNGYVGAYRTVSKLDVSEYEGISLWVKQDGSGNKMVLQFKDAKGDVWEGYIDSLASKEGEVQFAFSQFQAPSWHAGNSGTAGQSPITQIGIFVNGSGQGTLYADDIMAYGGPEREVQVPIDDSIPLVDDGQEVMIDSFDSSVDNWTGTKISYDKTAKALKTSLQSSSTNVLRKNLAKSLSLGAKKYIGYKLTYPKNLDNQMSAKIAGVKADNVVINGNSNSSNAGTNNSGNTGNNSNSGNNNSGSNSSSDNDNSGNNGNAGATTSASTGSSDNNAESGTTNSDGGLYIDGSKLKTAGGQEIVMRGVNLAHVFYRDRSMTDLQKISELGANAVRIVLTNGAYAANQWQKEKNTPSDIEPLVKFCKENGMVVVLDDQTTTGGDSTSYLEDAVNYWIEMKDFMNQYKDCVVLNIANEWSGKWVSDNPNYTSAYVDAVKKLRNAGIENVLMVDAAGWGQDIMGLAGVAQTILDADTTGNTMFSGHMYCYGAPDESGVKEHIDAFTNKNLCFCVGEFGWKHNPGSIPYKYIMSYAQENCAGWLAWSWYGNGAEGSYLAEGDLDMVNADNSLKSPWGTDVAEQWKGAKKISFATTTARAFTTSGLAPISETVATAQTVAKNATDGGMYVSGSKLYDADGNEFIMRGVNVTHTWSKDYTERSIKDAGELGSNCVRVALSDGNAKNFGGKTPLSEIEDIVTWSKESNQICVLELHDYTGNNDAENITTNCVNYWKEIKSFLNANKDYVILNIANEWFGNWDNMVSGTEKNTWKNAYKTAIKSLRDAGIENVIMVDAAGYANDVTTVVRDAKEVLGADANANTMFSYHMYSSFGGDVVTDGGGTGAAIKAGMDKLGATGVCYCIGEFGYWQNGGEVDERTILDYSEQKGIGWLAWSWGGNGAGQDSCLDMTLDTTYSGDDLTDWGKWVYGTKNGIQETSKLAYSCKSYSGTKVSGTIPDSMPEPTFDTGADISSSDTAGIDCGMIKDYEWVTAHNVDNDPSPWKTMKLGELENGGLTITDIDYSADKDATFQIESPEGMDISSHKTLDLVVRNNNAAPIQLDLIIKGGEFQFDNGIGSAWAETKSIDQTQLQNGRNHYINIPKNKTVHIQFSISAEYLDTGYDAEQILSNVKYLALRIQSSGSSSEPLDKSLDIISMGYDWADDKYEYNIAELNRPKTVCKWVWNRKDFGIGSTPTYSQDNEAGTLTINYDIQDDKGTGLQAQTNPGGDSKVGEDWTPYKSVTATLENTGDKEVHVTFLCRCGELWRWAENSGYDDNGRTPAEECIIGPNEKVNVRYLLNEATWRTEDSNFAASDSLTNLDIVKCVAFKIYTDGGTPASGTLTVSNFQVNFGETADSNPSIGNGSTGSGNSSNSGSTGNSNSSNSGSTGNSNSSNSGSTGNSNSSNSGSTGNGNSSSSGSTGNGNSSNSGSTGNGNSSSSGSTESDNTSTENYVFQKNAKFYGKTYDKATDSYSVWVYSDISDVSTVPSNEIKTLYLHISAETTGDVTVDDVKLFSQLPDYDGTVGDEDQDSTGNGNDENAGNQTNGTENNQTNGTGNNQTNGTGNNQTNGTGNDQTNGTGNNQTNGTGNNQTNGTGNNQTNGTGNNQTNGTGNNQTNGTGNDQTNGTENNQTNGNGNNQTSGTGNNQNTDANITGIELNVDKVTLVKGNTIALKAYALPVNTKLTNVRYLSNNVTVADVENDVIIAKSAGTATIIAQYGSYLATCTVTVVEGADTTADAGNNTGVTKNITLQYNKTKAISSIFAMSTTAGSNYTVTSSDTKVIKVLSQKGKIKAVGYGVAEVTMTSFTNANEKEVVTIVVKPGKVKAVKKKAVTKTIAKLTWKKQSGVKGYAVYKYSASKKKFVLYKKVKSNAITIKGLKSGSTNRYKVRAYAKGDSGIIYGSYSSVVKVKTK